MSKDWLKKLGQHLPTSIRWHPISTAPYNQILELRVRQSKKFETLVYPCLHTNTDAWINVDLGTEIKIDPVEWRLWPREEALERHGTKVNLKN